MFCDGPKPLLYHVGDFWDLGSLGDMAYINSDSIRNNLKRFEMFQFYVMPFLDAAASAWSNTMKPTVGGRNSAREIYHKHTKNITKHIMEKCQMKQ